METQKKTLVVLGNGFDVAFGYPTKYSDFYNRSLELRKYAKNGNRLCKYILDNVESDLWSDLESGLYKYSKSLTENGCDKECTEQFEKEFNELRKALFLYLKSISEICLDVASHETISGLTSEWLEMRPKILTFNYSQTSFSRFFGDRRIAFNNDDTINSNVFVYQHGSLFDTKNGYDNTFDSLVLGIDENKQKVDPSHSFLYKSHQKVFDLSSTMKDFLSFDIIIIYGCSFGASDASYFQKLFDNKDKTFIIYGYGEKGINDLKTNLANLGVNLMNLQMDNEVHFINSELTATNNPRQETRCILFPL